jgi:uncharacterized damage-inducible protein DinB
MFDRQYSVLMAQYNLYMNEKLYAMCAELSDEERRRDRGAFFKSIHGTLNHLLWGDRAFLIRLLKWDLAIGKPSDVLFDDFAAMTSERKRFDAIMLDWANKLEDAALSQPIEFFSVVYQRKRRMPLYLMVVQMFNHQTHHRGQLTTLLSQLGLDPGVTDLPFIPFADSLVTELS